MVKNSKGKSRLDKFYHLAKEQGFRSRAAFKLIQLNKKYNFFGECRTVLDLCAAPGGWMQVAAKHMPVSSMIVGVDLIPIRPVRNATSLVADITTDKCKKLIEKEADGRLFDVVLNDGSPNVGGAWHSESLSQAILVLDALKLATQFLAPKGWFITKVFRSKDYNALMYVCNQLFGKVEATKPTASRNASAEIFLVCQNYKAPAQIDSKLLDSRYVLQDQTSTSKMHGPVAMQKKVGKKMHRRFREGYEEGLSTTFKATSVTTLIKATDPVEMLGLYTQFNFVPAELPDTATPEDIAQAESEFLLVQSHKKTITEIRESCKDLLVLGKKEFKKLLKWQLSMAKELKAQHKADVVVEQDQDMNPEERMMKEMATIQERILHKAKKKEKKQREMKKQAKKRMAQFRQTEGMVEETINDPDLFALDMFNNEGQIEEQQQTSADPGLEIESESDTDSQNAEEENEDMKYERMLEDYLERSYQRFLKRKGEDADLEETSLHRRKRLDQAGELSEEDGDVQMNDAAEAGSDDEDASAKKPGGGLLVELDTLQAGVATTPEAISSQWFSQDIFQDEDLMEEDVEDDPEPIQPQPPVPHQETKPEANLHPAMDGAAASVDEDSDFEVVEQDHPSADTAAGSGTDTEDEFRLLDVDGKAEIIAMARKMLKRKEKESIIDAAYSRYVFHDKNLPKWFEHDNDVYNRPHRMVTRAEIEAEKEMLRALDSRPIKKVAEAKSRKAKRLANRLRSAMKRAEGVANQEELSHGTRMRQITKMMNTARKKENGKFVTKDQMKKMGRSKRLSATKKMPRVDKRAKSDKRVKGMGRGAKNLNRIRQKKNVEKQKRNLRRAKR